jgi:hypothetical protein
MNSSKSITLILGIVAILGLSISGCKEVGPPTMPSGKNYNEVLDTSFIESPVQAPEVKNVLVEDFTGIQCINCPDAHDKLQAEINATGRVIGVSLHSKFQDARLPESKQSLTDSLADQLQTYLGFPGFKPNGAVDRVLQTVPSGTRICDDRNNWHASITRQLAVNTPVNIKLGSSYNTSMKEVTITVELHYTVAQPDSDKVTVYLTEDSIITAQLLSDGITVDSNYVHNYVLRGALTSVFGDPLKYNLKAGTVVKKVYKGIITRAEWKPEHMHAVVFVHHAQNTKEILQTKSISLM